MKEDYQVLQKELPPLKNIGTPIAALMILEDWLKTWCRLHPLSFERRAAICSYEAADVGRQALYEWQGRRKRKYNILEQMIGDLIVMSMCLAVEQKVDLSECVKTALQRLESLEYKKSGAKSQ